MAELRLRHRIASALTLRLVCCAAVVAALAAGVAGCGGSSSADVVRVDDPVVAFAPLVLLHPRERLLPMPVDRYLDRSELWWADDWGCDHVRVARSRAAVRAGAPGPGLEDRGLGVGRAYEHPSTADDCTPRPRRRYAPGDLTRPQHPGPDRVAGIGPREGFHLEPAPGAWQAGTPLDPRGAVDRRVPAYFETAPARVDGQPGLRVAYWLFYGAGRSTWLEWWNVKGERYWGRDEIGHPGDWERIDVLLRREDGGYVPQSVGLRSEGRRVVLPWDEVERDGGHPVVYAALGSHSAFARAGFHETRLDLPTGHYVATDDAATCRGCPRWRTWRRLVDASLEPWNGYGGAWGPPGGSTASTGSLGPRGLGAVSASAGADADTLSTTGPGAAFAPLVWLDRRERHRPMSVDEFLAKSTLHWDHASPLCGYGTSSSGRVAIKKTPQKVSVTDPARLGAAAARAGAAPGGVSPYRHRQARAGDCAPVGRAYAAGELTRPFERRGRPAGLRRGEGFYLDLLTDATAGRRLAGSPAEPRVDGVPVYVERSPVVGGGGGPERVRFTYWMLFGAEAEGGGEGEGGEPSIVHEGDWERVSVLLERAGHDRWLPLAVRYHGGGDDGDDAEIPWRAAPRVEATHPIASLARGTHTPRPATADACSGCLVWSTWVPARLVHAQGWYGYGGAWGDARDDSRTTGPLGPGARR